MDYRKLLVSESATLLDALDALNIHKEKTLLVEHDGKFAATVTDGDIRRYILKSSSIDATVKDFANYSAIFLNEGENKKAKEIMKRYGMRVLPVVDEEGYIISAVTAEDAENAYSRSLEGFSVVINAGGKGTRLYPYTKILPKPLIPIGDVPIAELIINRFCDMGCRDFYIIVNHKGNMIKAYFNEVERDYRLTFVDETTPLGTGGGLSLLKGKLNNTFIFTNCDTIIDEDFSTVLCAHQRRGNVVTMICALQDFEFPYGVVDADEKGNIEAFREKPKLSYFVNTGCYIVEPQVLKGMQKNESIGFPTVVERLKEQNKRVGVYPVGQKSWLDMGQFDSMEDMKARLNIND